MATPQETSDAQWKIQELGWRIFVAGGFSGHCYCECLPPPTEDKRFVEDYGPDEVVKADGKTMYDAYQEAVRQIESKQETPVSPVTRGDLRYSLYPETDVR